MDTRLLELLECPVALLAEDGDTIRWTNDAFSRWFPQATVGSSLRARIDAFDSKRANRGLANRRAHSVGAMAPDTHARMRHVEMRRHPIELDGDALWVVEGSDQSKAAVKQSLLEGYAKTIEVNNRLLAQREKRLADKTAEMRRLLDHMQDGMFVVDRDGIVGNERSAACQTWFGDPSEPTAAAYLGAFDEDAGAWFEVAFDAVRDGLLPLDFTVPQLPTTMENDGTYLSLSYVPIADDEQLDNLLVIVSDVTANVERERAKQHEREVVELTRRMLRDRAGLEQFIEEIDAMLATLAAPECELETALRLLHTIKGNCALFGADGIASRCHELESRAIEQQSPPTKKQLTVISADWNHLITPIRKLMGVHDRSIVELSDRELASFVSVMDRAGSSREIKAIALSWRNPPVRNMLSMLSEQAATIASRLGKELDVVIRDNAMRLPLKPWRSFWTGMTHIVRNAVDHGIEDNHVRVAAGKPARGLVVFETEVVSNAIVIRVPRRRPRHRLAESRRKTAGAARPGGQVRPRVAL